MNERELADLVRARAGLRTLREAKHALGAVIGALRCVLEEDDALAMAKGLPPALARVMERPPSTLVRGDRAFYAETERRERVGLGFATEHAQVVLQVLSEQLDPEVVARLRRHSPKEVAALLRPRHPLEAPPPHVHTHPGRVAAPSQTLSRARPGTAEPIAETRHEVAHSGSVVRTTAPHAERLVETARSTRPGREDETLAATRGPTRRA